MLGRSLAALVVLVGVNLATSGCAAPTVEEEATEVSADELSAPRLRARMRLANVVEVLGDGTARVEYQPDAYNAEPTPAFEAVPFRAPEGAPVEVSVGGDFPSNAQVVVTDARLRVLAVSATQPVDAANVASVAVTAPRDGFVLVRDLRWVRPMQFDVRVSPIR